MSEKPLTAAEIVAAFLSNHYSAEDRVAFVRALRDSTPGLVVIDPRIKGRVRAARAVRPERIDTTINALENSEFWQQSCATTPKDIRSYRNLSEEHKALLDELRTWEAMVIDSSRYYHFKAVDLARIVYQAGLGISGEAALTIKPHLDLIAEGRPRRRRKSEETSPVVPKQ